MLLFPLRHVGFQFFEKPIPDLLTFLVGQFVITDHYVYARYEGIVDVANAIRSQKE